MKIFVFSCVIVASLTAATDAQAQRTDYRTVPRYCETTAGQAVRRQINRNIAAIPFARNTSQYRDRVRQYEGDIGSALPDMIYQCRVSIQRRPYEAWRPNW